jgi:hypothetical protein
MMYIYLRLIFNTWATLLIYIDKDSNVIDLYNRVNIEEVELFVRDKYINYNLSNNCLYMLKCIHIIYKIIELYIQDDYPMYTFFKLTNIVKYSETNNIDKYKELFKIPIDNGDDTTELYLTLEIEKPKIKKYMDIYMQCKTKLFEKEFNNFLNTI